MDYKKINIEVPIPQTTFYYVKSNGEVFACSEDEASLIHKQLKQYGVSDGKVYQKAIMAIKENLKTVYDEIDNLERELNGVEDVKEQKRLRSVINQKYQDIEIKLPKFIKKAQELDRESAKDNFINPKSYDFYDINGGKMNDNSVNQSLNGYKNIQL